MRQATSDEGVSVCPESATCIGALEMLADSGWIGPDERVVIFNCASARKYSDLIHLRLTKLKDAATVDWDQLAA